jgi:hypothetical protein
MNGTMELNTVQFAFLGQLIALGAVLWGLWRSVAAAGDKQAPVIASLKAELLAKIDAEVALASRARHDLANQTQTAMIRLEQDVERLKREAVRKEDLSAIENRITHIIGKMDTKVDLLNEKLVPLLALEKQVMSIDNRLNEALRRLEQVSITLKRDGAD